jgi:hypothetical protein
MLISLPMHSVRRSRSTLRTTFRMLLQTSIRTETAFAPPATPEYMSPSSAVNAR